MSIRFLCENEGIWMLDTPGNHMAVPNVDELIEIRGVKYRVNQRDWMADMKGVHVTIYLRKIL